MPVKLLTTLFTITLLIVILQGCAGKTDSISVTQEEAASAETETAEIESSVVQTEELIPEEVEPVIITGQLIPPSSETEQLTFGQADNGIATFHPAGSSIVFQSNRDGNWQIYELNFDNKESNRLIISDANDENPVWTTDGNSLLFVSDRDASVGKEWERDIYLFSNPDLGIMRITSTTADDWYPVADMDASFVFLTERDADITMPIYQRQNALYRGYLDGSPPVEIAGADLDPSSPQPLGDGNYLIRTSEGTLAILDPITTDIEELTPSTLRCGTFSLHPQWEWIVFSAKEADNAPAFALYLFDLGSRTIQKLDVPSEDIRYPQFSPDGSSIVYTAVVDGFYQLFNFEIPTE